MNKLRFLCLILSWINLNASARADTSAEEVFAYASQSVVTIVSFASNGEPMGLGSGVVVAVERVVTNCHVLRGADGVGVVHQGIGYEAQVADSMVSRDLCLLAVSGLHAPAMKLGRAQDLRVGQQVFTLGAPQGLELTFAEGMISSLRGDETLQLIQTSAPMSSGSSGGALLAKDGKLIGITTMGHRDGQNLNFAVPADWIYDFRTINEAMH